MAAALPPMKPGKIGVEETAETVHRIRITLSSKNVKNLEKGCYYLFVFAGSKFPDTECWLELNRIVHATLTNHVARRASLGLGSALLRTALTVFTEYPELKKMRACSYAPTATTPHHAPLLGALCGLLGVDAGTAQQSYLFMGVRDTLSGATRLNMIGPLEAAKLQHQFAERRIIHRSWWDGLPL